MEAPGREVAGVAQALNPVDRERLRELGANIRERRTAGDLTLEDLAASAGLSVTYLGQTERGQRNPSVLVLWRVADALGVLGSADLDEPGSTFTLTGRRQSARCAPTWSLRARRPAWQRAECLLANIRAAGRRAARNTNRGIAQGPFRYAAQP